MSTSYHCKIADKLRDQFVKEFAKPKGLILIGRGGAMANDIKQFFFKFITVDRSLDVEEARALYFEVLEEFLCRVNKDKEIRPYLHNFPFDHNNIELMLSFRKPDGSMLDDGNVAFMFVAKDILYYEAYDSTLEKIYDRLYTIHEENYTEARAQAKHNTICAFEKGIIEKKHDVTVSLSPSSAPVKTSSAFEKKYYTELLEQGMVHKKLYFNDANEELK